MSSEVQTELAGLQKALLDTDGVEQFLHELAVLAAGTIGTAGETISCGMALRQRGRPATGTAWTDPLASAADRAQCQSGDGPAVEVLRQARPAGVGDTATDGRWPRFSRQALSLGIRSCYAVPLVTDGDPVAALVLYARQPEAFGAEETSRADRFARNASGALTLALRLASRADENDQLRTSIVSRAVIDQALGVIMATERCSQEKALTVLRSVSQNTNVKLRDLAVTIVTSVSGEPPRPATPFEGG